MEVADQLGVTGEEMRAEGGLFLALTQGSGPSVNVDVTIDSA
jgi:hypothetical protein